MKPIFSVITVHFNQLALLKSTVENVISQEGFGELLEYIIVDGLSTDGTIDYLHQFNFEKSIHKIIERDKGIYDAMNKGIQKANGEYIIFINAGDQFYEQNALTQVSKQFADFNVLYGDTKINYENFSRTAKAKPLETFWKSLPFVHQSVIIKRSLLLNNLFNLNYTFCADYAQLATLYKTKTEFVYANKILSSITAGGTSDKQRIKATKEVFTIAKQIFGLTFWQKIFFRLKLLRGRMALFSKKILPQKTVQSITQRKYK